MQSDAVKASDDVIDLREIFAAVVANWKLVALTSVALGALTAYYVFEIAEPQFESSAVFELPSASGAPEAGALSAIAELGGLDFGAGQSQFNVTDLVEGRVFSSDLIYELGLLNDPFLNAELRDDDIPTLVLTFLGLIDPDEVLTDEAIMTEVIEELHDHVALGETANGAHTITVSHADPVLAKRITNTIVANVLQVHDDRKARDRELRTNYLRDELAEVQLDLDEAVANLQDFAVEANIATNQELFLQSQQLVRLRDRVSEIDRRVEALQALRSALESGLSETELEVVLDSHPELSSREVAIRLGARGSIKDWSVFGSEALIEAEKGLEEERIQVQRSLNLAGQDAERTAETAGELARLEREVNVATATFEVLTEQFKQQELLSGMDFSEGKIYTNAVIAQEPSKPRKVLLTALSLLAGTVVGAIIAVVRSASRNTLYSQRALFEAFGSRARFFRGRSLPSWFKGSGSSPRRMLRRFGAIRSEEHKLLSFALNSGDKVVAVLPATEREARGLSFMLASQLNSAEQSVLVMDFVAPMRGAGEKRGMYSVQAVDSNLDHAHPLSPETLSPRAVARPDFLAGLEDIFSGYDRAILVLPPFAQGSYLLEALHPLKMQVVTTVRLGNVTQDRVDSLMSLLFRGGRETKGLLVIW